MDLYASNPTDYENLVTREIAWLKPEKVQCALDDPNFDIAFHHILVIEPSPTSRGVPEKRIASRRVFELLWKEHLRHQVSDMKYFYDRFQASATTAASAGWVFQHRMHQLLSRKRTIRLYPVFRGPSRSNQSIYKGYPGENPTDVQLARSDEYPLVEGGGFHVNRYYRPESTDLHSIDSLLLVHPPDVPPVLLMFRIIGSEKEHDVNEDDLRRIGELDLAEGTRMCYVIVTPEGVEPEIKVPRMVDEGQLSDNMFQVFNYPVPLSEVFPSSLSSHA